MNQPKITKFHAEALMPLVAERLQAGQEVSLTVTGISMRPLFWHGRTRVLLSHADSEGLRRYDIPLYKRENGQYVLHRVIRKRKNDEGYLITGDAQWVIEEVFPSQVIGKVTGVYRGDKAVPISAFRYRAYAVIWTALLPVRKQIFWCFRNARRFLRHLKKVS